MNKIELLAPAGNLEKAKIAFYMGRMLYILVVSSLVCVRVQVTFPLTKSQN